MKTVRVLLFAFILVFIFIAGLLFANPSSAQNGPIWLPFDGTSVPSEPSLELLNASSAEINLQATLPGAYAETITASGISYTRLSAPGYGFPATYGLPELPVLRQEVEIPFGAQVTFELVSAQYTDRTLIGLGLHPIYPMQPPVPKVEGIEDNQPLTIDAKYYASGSPYPSRVISIGEPYIVRGHRILPVEVWPVAYDPSQGSLRFYSQVTFRLHLTGSNMVTTYHLADRYSSPVFDPSLSRGVLNYNQGRPLRVNAQVGYLIISADTYADSLAPLVTLRQSRGFEVTLTRLSEIPGGNTPADIKAYIQNAYDTWPVPPSYVLLVGDTDTLPTWTGPVIGTSTDLYYATMDGGDDWHPDIGRGRFPVRSPEQTTYMVDKYLFYADLNGQEPWLKTASFPATCDNYTVAEGTHNYVIGNYTAPGGWTGTFPTDPNPGGDQLYCVTYGATHQDLLDQFYQGRWAIIYSGHGSYGGWEMDYTPTDIRNMPANSMYPFVASHACLSGDFGQDEVFGETWVLQEGKGALVYWGSSTYSYWGEDDILERAMFDSLFAPATPHADVTAMTYDGLYGVEAIYPDSARYYWETYNVLGDPSVHLFMEPELPSFTLNLEPSSQEICSEGAVTSTVEIGSVMGYSSTVYLETGVLPFNVTASFDPAQSAAPYTSSLTLDVTAGAPIGDHDIVITATDQVSWTHDTLLNLRINSVPPITPTLLSPEDGDLYQPLQPNFVWEDPAFATSSRFQLGYNPLFEQPLIDVSGLTQASYTPPDSLQGGTCHWWRIQSENVCGASSWTYPFHFATINLYTPFFDDLEGSLTRWHHAAAVGSDLWQLVDFQYHSASHSWYVPDMDSITDSSLWFTDTVQVGPGSRLTFWQMYSFESNYDGAVLEYSTDGGDTWLDLGEHFLANGYNGIIATGYDNPLAGRNAWVGEDQNWKQVEVDLGFLSWQTVLIRWRHGSDSSVGANGWYIDDVQIKAPLPPNPAPTLLTIIPNSGVNTAPTPVVIRGSGFLDVPAFSLGETWLISVTLVSSTTVEAVIPAGLPIGSYDLALTNGDCQQVTIADAFEVLASPIIYNYNLPLVVR